MEWVSNNFSALLVFIGLALLAIEVGLLGFSVFVLFFIGMACIVAGLLMMAGLLPETLIAAFGAVAILTLLFAVVLWKPLKRMQGSGERQAVKGDFIGHTFTLEYDVSPQQAGSHRYSGITWKVKSEMPLSAGTQVEVVRAEVGELTVSPKHPA